MGPEGTKTLAPLETSKRTRSVGNLGSDCSSNIAITLIEERQPCPAYSVSAQRG
jgi:hypothetical protein